MWTLLPLRITSVAGVIIAITRPICFSDTSDTVDNDCSDERFSSLQLQLGNTYIIVAMCGSTRAFQRQVPEIRGFG